jgi:hypothetical protein
MAKICAIKIFVLNIEKRNKIRRKKWETKKHLKERNVNMIHRYDKFISFC